MIWGAPKSLKMACFVTASRTQARTNRLSVSAVKSPCPKAWAASAASSADSRERAAAPAGFGTVDAMLKRKAGRPLKLFQKALEKTARSLECQKDGILDLSPRCQPPKRLAFKNSLE